MMTDVWILSLLWESDAESQFLQLVPLLPEARLTRLSNVSASKKIQAAAAWGLLRCGLHLYYGIPTLPALQYGVYGKPAFQDRESLHFNLSHTDGLALCALGACAVGVDAERIRAVSPQRAERLHLPQDARPFFEGWVERESRVKCRGGSGITCRRSVPPEPGEVYLPLNFGMQFAAGVAMQRKCRVHLLTLETKEVIQVLAGMEMPGD